jgi:hypothetical protein
LAVTKAFAQLSVLYDFTLGNLWLRWQLTRTPVSRDILRKGFGGRGLERIAVHLMFFRRYATCLLWHRF